MWSMSHTKHLTALHPPSKTNTHLEQFGLQLLDGALERLALRHVLQAQLVLILVSARRDEKRQKINSENNNENLGKK